jgi:hypothetical protein
VRRVLWPSSPSSSSFSLSLFDPALSFPATIDPFIHFNTGNPPFFSLRLARLIRKRERERERERAKVAGSWMRCAAIIYKTKAEKREDQATHYFLLPWR